MRNIFIILFLISIIQAQNKLTGFYTVDNALIKYEQNDSKVGNFIYKKSSFLAGGMSLILPGAGQLYSKNYFKALGFALLEGILIYLKIDYDNKGDDQTKYFENYANNNWDAAKYARWSLKKFGLNEQNYPNLFADATKTKIGSWKILNKLEEDISRTDLGKYYSHQIAPFGDQQYYEMIGKYPQFVPGWSTFDENDLSYQYGSKIPDQYLWYSDQRGKANSFYNKANTVFAVIMVNHVLSAIDAVIGTNNYNKKISLRSAIKTVYFGSEKIYFPELNIKIRI